MKHSQEIGEASDIIQLELFIFAMCTYVANTLRIIKVEMSTLEITVIKTFELT